MPRTWLQLEVVLVEGRGEVLDPAPGRILLTGGTHTFADLAAAIDQCFARWDRGHLHLFELPGGRLIGPLDEDDPAGDGWEDENELVLVDVLQPGSEFSYTFDLGDQWRHSCHIAADLVDPRQEVGEVPKHPRPLWGWGMIPDQYGRLRPDG